MPGQTQDRQVRVVTLYAASMEGRAIARPNRHCERHDQDSHSASMEGRAIARPNLHTSQSSSCSLSLQWRAGQLPGQTTPASSISSSAGKLQWRAGQLPGQTSRCVRRSTSFNGGPGNCPAKRRVVEVDQVDVGFASMEGRAIARPNDPHRMWAAHGSHASMEGRAIARPNCDSQNVILIRLQWRAGQLPGQTGRLFVREPHLFRASMEGRAIARPNLTSCYRANVAYLASMEGRAIARPNLV